jgi:hypothetical protein
MDALYGLDIETDTSVDGLDPAVARIVAVAVAGGAGRAAVFADDDEATLLDRVDRHLAGLAPGVVVTWNGAAFDLPFLADRAGRAGVRLGLRVVLDPAIPRRHPPLVGHDGAYRAGWYGHAHLDAYRVFRADVGPSLGVSASLKAMARLCGLCPIELDRPTLHRRGRSELAAYVGSDAECTRELVRRRWSTARLAIDRAPDAPIVG